MNKCGRGCRVFSQRDKKHYCVVCGKPATQVKVDN